MAEIGSTILKDNLQDMSIRPGSGLAERRFVDILFQNAHTPYPYN
jgi:hypothetical protein